MPEPSLFTDEEKPATASIVLKLRPRMMLDRAQVEGIQRLVAGSVEGLEMAGIAVLDNESNLLSEEVDPLARFSTKQIEIQRDVEEYLEKRTQGILDKVLGPDQAFVRLSVELNFDEIQEEIEAFDPATAVLISEERTETSSAEAGTRETSVSNWEVNRSVKRVNGAPGPIKRISASLMINDKVPLEITDTGPTYRTRSPEELAQITDIARGALGIDEVGRGDQLTVSQFVFAVQDLRFAEEQKRKSQEREALVTNILINVAKGVAIVIALLVLRAIIGAIGRGVAREEEIAMEAQRELAEEDVAEELPETPHEILLGRIAMLITERPEDAAKLIRTMLIEDAQQSSAG
jgi:flagellar M-ring protein FliF